MDLFSIALGKKLPDAKSLPIRVFEHKGTDANGLYSWADGYGEEPDGSLFLPVIKVSETTYLFPVSILPGYSADYLYHETGGYLHHYNFSFDDDGMWLQVHKQYTLTERE